MSIAFNVLPDTVRVPFAYAEFDGSGASDDPALMPYTVLMVGQMLDSGTAEAGTVQRPMSAAQAATLFGEGSQLAAMCAAYLNANSITKMLAIGVKDAEEGTAAKGALTINGTCVNAAPLCLYINGKLVRAAAPLAAEASAVAENLTNAINADKSLPVTATFSGGEVSLTARHKGECGNDIDLRISYYDEDKPGGLTFSFTDRCFLLSFCAKDL
jgi:phage tail sheath gpL-like